MTSDYILLLNILPSIIIRNIGNKQFSEFIFVLYMYLYDLLKGDLRIQLIKIMNKP